MSSALEHIQRSLRLARNAIRYVRRRDIGGLVRRLRQGIRPVVVPTLEAGNVRALARARWGIIAAQQSDVARRLADRLKVHGWQVEVTSSVPAEFSHDFYIVIDPQGFSRLPPGKRRIAFPITSSAGSRSLADDQVAILKGSLAVLSHSLADVEFMTKQGIVYPQLYYLPIPESEVQDADALTFAVDRFLVGVGFLPASHVRTMRLPLPDPADRIALSLPETIARRCTFEKPPGYVLFDGIRRRPSWIGCGLSYQALAQHAIPHGTTRLEVMEDDVVLPRDFEAKLTVVREFLEKRAGKWDVFAGVVASLHQDTKVASVDRFRGITFVTINKMTSTVFNIYGDRALRLLMAWDPEDHDIVSNPIDRFLERQPDLRVVVALPFIVGHREEVDSTLWGVKNTHYRDMIAQSEMTLGKMIADI